MYNKIFTKILDSSIWLAPDPHRLVWITLIAAMDSQSIATFACPENLAARARVSLEDTLDAIKAFESPDPYDPSQEFEGRRIERVPGGWLILNGERYRNLVTRAVATEQSRLRMQRFRDKQSKLRNVTQPLQPVTPSVSVSVSEEVSEKKPMSDSPTVLEVFDHWKSTHNHPQSKLDAKRKKVITQALKNYSIADLRECITGYLNSPHHMGDNPRKTKYDDIELFLRDAKHIDAGIAFARNPPSKLSTLTQGNVSRTAGWVPPDMRRGNDETR